MKKQIHIIIAVITLLISACSKVVIKTEQPSPLDWSTVRTYSWDSSSTLETLTGKPIDIRAIERRIRSSVQNQMQAKGLSLGKTANTDITVFFTVLAEAQVDLHKNPKWLNEEAIRDVSGGPGEAYHFPVNPTSKFIEYHKGTIAIQIKDSKTGSVVWLSIAQGIVDYDISQSKREQRIDKIIKRMFSGFPN